MLCKIKTLPFFKVKRMVERAENKAQVLMFESAVAVLFEKQDTHLVGQKKKSAFQTHSEPRPHLSLWGEQKAKCCISTGFLLHEPFLFNRLIFSAGGIPVSEIYPWALLTSNLYVISHHLDSLFSFLSHPWESILILFLPQLCYIEKLIMGVAFDPRGC